MPWTQFEFSITPPPVEAERNMRHCAFANWSQHKKADCLLGLESCAHKVAEFAGVNQAVIPS